MTRFLIRLGRLAQRSLLCALSLCLLSVAPALAQTESKLTASDGAEGDRFGASVSVSGNIALIGASLDDDTGSNSGSAYVFRYDGTQPPGQQWVEEQKLTASDGAPGDQFGFSVSLSSDVAIVGTPNDDDSGGGSGSAYIFRYDGTQWVEEQKLTASDGSTGALFGVSVSVSGNIALIGASLDDDTGSNSGSAYVFRYDGTQPPGQQWVEEQKLTASDGAGSDQFGWSVSVSGEIALSSAVTDDDTGPNSGSVYVFRYDGTQPPGQQWVEEQKLTASDGAGGDRFGSSVSVSAYVALVGANRDDENGGDQGSAYVFRYDGTQWVEEQKLTASDGALGDLFGQSVSILGDIALVGAHWDDENGDDSGSAYLFRFEGTGWAEDEKFTASDGAGGDNFGISVSASGGFILVGAHWDDDDGDDSGSAYLYDFSPPAPLYAVNTLDGDNDGACDPGGTGPDDDCSLLEAVALASTTGQPETITFAVAGTILLDTTVVISAPLTLDGASAPGGAHQVTLDASASAGSDAVQVTGVAGAGAAIHGLVIGNASGDGIEIRSAGVSVYNTYIGTNPAGADLGNGFGIHVINAAGTRIGGTTPDSANVIGHNGQGIFTIGTITSDVVIAGNYIGTDATGADLGNGGPGITVSSPGVTVGGTAPGAGNTVGHSSSVGIFISGAATTGIVVAGNYIGTNAAGADLGNSAGGIEFGNGASGNTVGGTTAGAGNTIAHNDNAGIFASSEASTENALLQNTVFANAGPGIDLGFDGPTPNDPGDPDEGPNRRQNTPDLAAATLDGADLTVTYLVDTDPMNATYPLRVELFRADADSTGGEVFLGFDTYADYGGCGSPPCAKTATLTPGVTLAEGDVLVATATDESGNTSELSAPLAIGEPPPNYDVEATPTTPLTVNPGGSVSFAFVVSNNTDSPIAGDFYFVAETASGATVAQGIIQSGTLPAGAMLAGTYTQGVPGNAPPGDYTFRLVLGSFPTLSIDEEVFVVTVEPAARSAEPAARAAEPSARVAVRTAEEWSVTEASAWRPVDSHAALAAVVGADAAGRLAGVLAGAHAGASLRDGSHEPRSGREVADPAASASEPTAVSLYAPYPNPSRGETRVGFTLPETGEVQLVVYDLLGREVVRLVDGERTAGRHEVLLGGAGLPSGVYVVRLMTSEGAEIQRVTLVR